MTNCIFCSHELAACNNSDLLSSSYSSLFSSTKASPQIDSHSFYFTNCQGCGVPCISSSSVYPLLGFLHPELNYNEPSFHHSDIFEFLSSFISTKGLNIISFTSKDHAISSYFSSSHLYDSQLFDLGLHKNSSSLFSYGSISELPLNSSNTNIWFATRLFRAHM